MLEAMLDAAINWIRAGLPMKCLKIVIYTRSARKLSQEEQTLVAAFEKMQRKVEQFQAQQKVSQRAILVTGFVWVMETLVTGCVRVMETLVTGFVWVMETLVGLVQVIMESHGIPD